MMSGIIKEFPCIMNYFPCDYFAWSERLQIPINSTENDWRLGEDQDPIHFLHVFSYLLCFHY